MSCSETKCELVQVRVSIRQKRAIETAARRRGLSISELIRRSADALVTQVAT